MTGPSLHGIQGRFLKDGSTEYRAMSPEGGRGRLAVILTPRTVRRRIEVRFVGVPGFQASTFPTRQAAIERIEQLLTT